MHITENIEKENSNKTFVEIEADSELDAHKKAEKIAETQYSHFKNMGWNISLSYESDTLGFSGALDNSLDNKLNSLNESISNEYFIQDNFQSVEFELNDLELNVVYKTKSGKSGKQLFSSHIDDGAIYLYADYIKAYFGEEKFLEVQEEFDNNGGEFDSDFLKTYENVLYNQLAQDYLLSCSPDVEGGAEFTDQDLEFFKSLLKG